MSRYIPGEYIYILTLYILTWVSIYRLTSGRYIYIYSPEGWGVYALYATSSAFEVSRDHGIYICTTFTPQIKGKPVHIPYNGNDSRKKTFANFAILGAFVNVFLQIFSYN